jgi:formylglycine-generating enzyme required for sulfatase activity
VREGGAVKNRLDMARVSAALAAALALGCQGLLGIEEPILVTSAGGGSGMGGSGASGSGASTGGAASKRSCVGLPATCGPNGDADCCASSVVPGGTFYRSYDGATYNDQGYPATVSSFVLDTYEVTVGRFRKFVEAYPDNMPAEGSGRNPNDPRDPGWDSAWNDAASSIPKPSTLPGRPPMNRYACADETWTDTPGANENLPMSCFIWEVAFAFCIWDGGRLPTEAEWNYAAAGGAEQREYPWGDEAADDTRAVYCGADGGGVAASGGACPGPKQVGSKSPEGNGKWGQADLAGNLHEWTRDQYFSPYTQVECVNCANRAAAASHACRGGSYRDGALALLSSYRAMVFPEDTIGVRCARDAP